MRGPFPAKAQSKCAAARGYPNPLGCGRSRSRQATRFNLNNLWPKMCAQAMLKIDHDAAHSVVDATVVQGAAGSTIIEIRALAGDENRAFSATGHPVVVVTADYLIADFDGRDRST